MDNQQPVNREDLRAVARSQRAILLCILIYFVALVAQFPLPATLRGALGVAALVVSLVATYFVFQLAIRLYNAGVGVLLAVLTLIPCVGLIVLLIINGKATALLTSNGIQVGMLGANPDDIP